MIIDKYGLIYKQVDIEGIKFNISIDTTSTLEEAVLLNFCFYQSYSDTCKFDWDNRVFDLLINYEKNLNKLYIEYEDTLLLYGNKIVPKDMAIDNIFIIDKELYSTLNEKNQLKYYTSYVNKIVLFKNKKKCFQQYMSKKIIPKNIPFRLVYIGEFTKISSNWIVLE